MNKLTQVNEDRKCPKCKKFTLLNHHGYESIGYSVTDGEIISMWDIVCENCGAKFINGEQNE